MGKPKKPEERAKLLKSSQEKGSNDGLITLDAAKLMAQGMNPNATNFLIRKIVRYYAIRIFHAPFSFPGSCANSWKTISDLESGYSASLTTDLKKYLIDERTTKDFPVSINLWNTVGELVKTSAKNSLYLVIEEHGSLGNCEMSRGECWEAVGAELIDCCNSVYLFRTMNGNWPNVHEQEEFDTTLLAAMRIVRKATHPFELHARSLLYKTDKNEIAIPIEGKLSIAYGAPRALSSYDTDLDSFVQSLAERVNQFQKASSEQAIHELLYAVRLDKSRDDEYFRLWYLRLHQALVDLMDHCQNPDLKCYLKKLRKEQWWIDLNYHRNCIAHHHTERADYQKISDLHEFALKVLDRVSNLALSK